jgi:hypothetical protein
MKTWTYPAKIALLCGVGVAASVLMAQNGGPVAKPVDSGTKASEPGRFQIVQVNLPASVAGGSTVIKLDTETGATWSISQGNPSETHSVYVWYKIPNVTLTSKGSIIDTP